jgi:hypothetical protein
MGCAKMSNKRSEGGSASHGSKGLVNGLPEGNELVYTHDVTCTIKHRNHALIVVRTEPIKFVLKDAVTAVGRKFV